MYEFMILGQLSRRPLHGYMIAKIIGHIIGPFRQVQWGALYPVLGRLEREGLIRAEQPDIGVDGRQRKVYAITDAGRARLHEHLLDTEHHVGEYGAMFTHKVAYFHLLKTEERVRLCRHYAVYTQRVLDHLDRKCRDLMESEGVLTTEQKHDLRCVLGHGSEHWAHEHAWAQSLLEEEIHKEAV